MNSEIFNLIYSSKESFSSDLEAAISYARKAVDISRKSKLKEELAESLITLVHALSEKGNIDKVDDYLYEAIRILETIENSNILLKAYSALGTVYLKTGELDNALTAFKTSLDLSLKIDELDEKTKTLLGIGSVLALKKSYDDALNYSNLALEASRKSGDINSELKSLNNIGFIYNCLNRLDKAEESLNQCILLCNTRGYDNVLVTALDELGVICKKKGNGEKAEENWKKAIEFDTKRGESFYSIAPLLNLADYYFSIKKLEESKNYLQRARKLCIRTNSKLDLISIYELESKINEARGQYKEALKFYKKMHKLDKEIGDQDSVRELKEREYKIIQESKERLVALGHVGRAITETLDMETMVCNINKYAKEIFNFNIIGIAQYREEKREIAYEFFMEDGAIIPKFYSDVDNVSNLAGWVIRNKKSIVIQDTEKEVFKYVVCQEKIANRWGATGKMPRSILYNPLIVADKIIGIFTIQSYSINSFSADDIESFKILSSYVAIGFNNALQSRKIKDQNKELLKLSITDSLTGLKNRRSFFDDLNLCWNWSFRTRAPLSVILLDLDHFKEINDTYGHPAGDYCLIEIAKILRRAIRRESDEVARLGGEEFGIFLGGTDNDGANTVAESILSEIRDFDFNFIGMDFKITASIGIKTVFPAIEHKIDIGEVISDADKALYEAKRSGRNCVVNFF